ncbi:MAG: HK97 family phage prohead protease [Atribacterota bacterium]|nr:HK97 family phage prohead protease [Atribacterota bacterium]
MPLPKVKENEEKDDFLSRCMGDKTMNDEYLDEKQRYAICNQIWRDKDKDSLEIIERIRETKSILETRSYPFEISEVREEGENITKITGYAAVYNQLSDDLGGFREKIKKGFFTEVITTDDVRALFNHDANMILGRTKNDTLKLEEDKNGLKVEIIPPDTTYANNLVNLIRRGDVDQMSFQWQTEKDEWDSSDLNNVTRTLIKAKRLWDISPVTFPAYPQTSAEVNSARQVLKNYLENYLEEHPDDNTQENREWQERISIAKKKLTILEREI